MAWEAALAALGVASAGGAGLCGWLAWSQRARRSALARRLREEAAGDGGARAHQDLTLDERAIALAQGATRRAELQGPRARLPPWLARAEGFERLAPSAGLEGSVSAQGFAEARLSLALGGLAVGALLGAPFSGEFSAALGLAGAVAGWRLLGQAVRRRVAARTQELERHLPEMLDVMAMGMRSGLSFDRSLGLYVRYFPTMLAEAFDAAQRQWSHGLARRDEALRSIAKTYDSPIFGRVVESIIRSLRFGSSLSASLEALAAEARVSYRTRRQEQVAKAPIKIMVPTGTLILPAMLIVVLGPVLLELMGDF